MGDAPAMHVRGLQGVLLCLLLQLAQPAPTLADQPRDWMVAPTPGGTRALVDLILPGVQAGLEHRVPIYREQNELLVRASSLFTLGFLDNRVDVDVRVLVLTLGLGAGYRNVYRSLEFEPDESLTMRYRHRRDRGGLIKTASFPWGEARASLSLPMNDNLVVHNQLAFRIEDRHPRSYDWRYGLVHNGRPLINETYVYFKHADWGAIAPVLQAINYRRDHRRQVQLNWGLQVLTRTGITDRDNIFVAQVLFQPGDHLGGVDNSDQYGFHLLKLPFNFIVAQRMIFDL